MSLLAQVVTAAVALAVAASAASLWRGAGLARRPGPARLLAAGAGRAAGRAGRDRPAGAGRRDRGRGRPAHPGRPARAARAAHPGGGRGQPALATGTGPAPAGPAPRPARRHAGPGRRRLRAGLRAVHHLLDHRVQRRVHALRGRPGHVRRRTGPPAGRPAGAGRPAAARGRRRAARCGAADRAAADHAERRPGGGCPGQQRPSGHRGSVAADRRAVRAGQRAVAGCPGCRAPGSPPVPGGRAARHDGHRRRGRCAGRTGGDRRGTGWRASGAPGAGRGRRHRAARAHRPDRPPGPPGQRAGPAVARVWAAVPRTGRPDQRCGAGLRLLRADRLRQPGGVRLWLRAGDPRGDDAGRPGAPGGPAGRAARGPRGGRARHPDPVLLPGPRGRRHLAVRGSDHVQAPQPGRAGPAADHRARRQRRGRAAPGRSRSSPTTTG